jgi:DNA-binding GntR family transcriptional regulator
VSELYRIFGSEMSPYSVKVRSYFRYKAIPHVWIARGPQNEEDYKRFAKLPIVPTVATPADEGLQDSTPILERVEAEVPEPSIHPADPVLNFLSALFEEFGDEWGNKLMFHHRWYDEIDARASAQTLARLSMPNGEDAAVAERAAVSRTSVRQALNVLAAEGFVELHPNRGAMVIEWSSEILLQVFDLRVMLEAYGCELAASHASAQDVADLRAEADRFSELVAKRNRRHMNAIAESNNRLHRKILDASGNRHLASLLTAVVQVPMVSQTFARYDQAALERSAAHHQDLVHAIAAGDRELARATMQAHILAGKRVIFSSREGDAAPAASDPVAQAKPARRKSGKPS